MTFLSLLNILRLCLFKVSFILANEGYTLVRLLFVITCDLFNFMPYSLSNYPIIIATLLRINQPDYVVNIPQVINFNTINMHFLV